MAHHTRVLGCAAAALCAAPAFATISSPATVLFSDPSGLSAEAEFTLLDTTTLQIRLKNTSTGAPDGFDTSDQILTSISWDPGEPPITITGGSVFTGPNSSTINFDAGDLGANADVSGEWGYGNDGGTGLMLTFISGNAAGATPFGGADLDGPNSGSLNGPQGGLVSNPPVVAELGNTGVIMDEIVATVTLDTPTSDLAFLELGATIEFGSDAAFITSFVPAPGAAATLALAGLIGLRRRR